MHGCVCVSVCVSLLVFFRGGEVQFHGLVDLPVLLTDQLQGEGPVQHLRTHRVRDAPQRVCIEVLVYI